MSGLVTSLAGPSSRVEPPLSNERRRNDLTPPPLPNRPTNTLTALSTALSSKLYIKSHLEITIEKVESPIPYPSRFHGPAWTPVIASLRGGVLKVVPDRENARYTETFPISGAIVEPAGIPNAAFRLILTSSAATISILFSCSSAERRDQWIISILWSSWERTRLDEIYTASILKKTVCGPGTSSNESLGKAPTTLNNEGTIEGYVFVQLGGQSPDPNHLYLTLSKSNSQLKLYLGHKGRERKKPVISVSHAHLVYIAKDRSGISPSKRGCIMIHGKISRVVQEMTELNGGAIKLNDTSDSESWIAIEPDESRYGSSYNILDWLIALHDVFKLYGRPHGWVWDASDPRSLDFGLTRYPAGRSVLIPRRMAHNVALNYSSREAVYPQFETMLLTRITEIVLGDLGISDSDPAPDQNQRGNAHVQSSDSGSETDEHHASGEESSSVVSLIAVDPFATAIPPASFTGGNSQVDGHRTPPPQYESQAGSICEESVGEDVSVYRLH